jgi:hypothetical protein
VITAAAALLSALAVTANAQSVTQTLSIAFVGGDIPTAPLGGWLPAFIAGVLALAAAIGLRRRGKGATCLWTSIVVSASALLLDNVPSSEAGVPTTLLPLLGSPASVQFTFSGAASFTVVDAFNTLPGSITIANITLTPGPYSIVVAPASPTTGPKLVTPGCFVGESLTNGQKCFVDLEITP